MPIITPSGGGGGGSQPPSTLGRASYSGTSVTIPNGDSAWLTWNSLGSGDALLDIASDPAHPTVVAGGIYALTANVNTAAFLTAGGFIYCVLHMDSQNEDAIAGSDGMATSAGDFTRVSLALTWYIPAGGAVGVRVFNLDGASSRPAQLSEALLQLIAG